MHLILLILGLATTAAGLAAIAMGIPINEFGLGNTLILAGTIGLVGGLLLVGLALALRQLRRVVVALEARPLPHATDLPQAGHSRAGTGPPVAPEPLTLPEEVLAPARAKRSATRGRPPERPAGVDRPAPSDLLHGLAARAEQIGAAREPEADAAVVSKSVGEIAAAGQPAETASEQHAPEPERSEAPRERPAVVKSGILNGMPYTLYLDGTIEAELPEGPRHFASIDELRTFFLDRAGPYAAMAKRAERASS